MQKYKKMFFDLALDKGILRFGEFTLKSGRVSPYFFNAGGFDDGASLQVLAECYAMAIIESGVTFDMLFGPAYKGIPLAAAVSMSLHDFSGQPVPFAYNRKEAKDHGEGGVLVGAPMSGKVLIIDDVISAGTSVRESIDLIDGAGAQTAGVAIALDRQERGLGEMSAAEEVTASHNVPVVSIAGLSDLIDYLELKTASDIDIDAIARYRSEYGSAGASLR